MWNEIKKLVDEHGYMSGVNRMSDRVKETGEVFTPTDLVIEILKGLPISMFAPGKTVLDPACGDGQFLVAVKWLKVIEFNMSQDEALEDIYGVDIMRDNVDLCKERLEGGNIVMGNTLEPNIRLDEQTDEEHRLMIKWFGVAQLSFLE
jgi:ubiquinone/menaquinone biosynthesis C-methylase UbiE